MLRIVLAFLAVFAAVFAMTFVDLSGGPAPEPVRSGEPAAPLVPPEPGPAAGAAPDRPAPRPDPAPSGAGSGLPLRPGPVAPGPDRELRDIEALEAQARTIESRIEALVGRLADEDADEEALAAELESLLQQYDTLMDP